MSRSIKTLIALCALISAAACNNIAGPLGDATSTGPKVGDRSGDQIANPDQVDPGDGDGGGGGAGVKEDPPIKIDPIVPEPRNPGDVSPDDGDSAGN